MDAWTAVVLELDVGAGWCTTMGVMLRKDLNPTWYRRYGLVKVMELMDWTLTLATTFLPYPKRTDYFPSRSR